MSGTDLTLVRGPDGVWALPDQGHRKSNRGSFTIGIDLGSGDRTGFFVQQLRPDGAWENVGSASFVRDAMGASKAKIRQAMKRAIDDAVQGAAADLKKKTIG